MQFVPDRAARVLGAGGGRIGPGVGNARRFVALLFFGGANRCVSGGRVSRRRLRGFHESNTFACIAEHQIALRQMHSVVVPVLRTGLTGSTFANGHLA